MTKLKKPMPANNIKQTSSAREKLDTVQAARALAALCVLLFHGTEIVRRELGLTLAGGSFNAGFAGVDIFFVLSGFIILHTANQRMGAVYFLAFRAIRIYPVYWIVTTLLVMAYLASPSLEQAHKGDPAVISGSLLLLPQPKYVVGVAWTLFYEMLFYTLVALTYFRRPAYLDYAFLAWATVSGAVHVAGYQSESFTVNAVLDPIVLEFYFGCLVARFYRQHGTHAAWPVILAAGALSFAGSWALYLHASPSLALRMSGVLRSLFFGVPAALIVLGLLYYKGRVPRVLVAIGDGTYSIYLLHGTLIAVLLKVVLAIGLPAAIGKALTCASVLGGALVAGWMFYRLVERPVIVACKSRLDGLFHSPKASSAAVRTTKPER